jgi:hypothetical protein
LQIISKKGTPFLIGLAAILLSGCGSNKAPLDDADIINRALIQLSDAQSIEYTSTSEDSVSYGEKINRNETYLEVRQIASPFTAYSKSDRKVLKTDGTVTKTVIETFQSAEETGFNFYLRYISDANRASDNPPPTEWQKNSLSDKESVGILIDMRRKTDEAQIELLRENMSSFKRVSNSDDYVYQGTISPDSVLNVYRDFVRLIYIKGGLVKGPDNPSKSDLNRELTSEARPEFQTGFTKLAYSQEPVPVTIYINRDTYQLEKVMLDEKSALQAILSREIPKINPDLGAPVVTKSMNVYEIKGINMIKELELPD